MKKLPRLFTFAAPKSFYRLASITVPWLYGIAAAFAIWGLYVGFFVAPVDATQGNSYRIIFIHVPAAWMSMVLYMAMAGWAAFGCFQKVPRSLVNLSVIMCVRRGNISKKRASKATIRSTHLIPILSCPIC